jgi:hypothetical protein
MLQEPPCVHCGKSPRDHPEGRSDDEQADTEKKEDCL